MNEETKVEAPWVGFGGEDEWRGILMGNRKGLEILRDGIDRALACDANAALVEERGFPIHRVQIFEKDPRPKPQPKKGRDWKGETKEVMWLLISAAAAIIFLVGLAAIAFFIWLTLR